jgi:glycosyltransferase involved in cell wall biosynthesis
VTRKGLLLLSPIMPDEQGNGLAMRAGLALRALSRRFDVHLGLVPVAGGPQTPSPLVRRAAATIRSLPLAEHLDPYYRLIERILDQEARRRARIAYPKPYLSRFCTSQSASIVAEWRRAQEIAAVHVVRLYLAPLAGSPDGGFRVLDLDEDDATTHRRIADLRRAAGSTGLAETEDAEAAKYATLLAQSLGRFHRVLVSSPVEVERVRRRVPEAAITIVPNAAPPAGASAGADGRPDRPLRLVFVGNLGYAPNEDAVLYLCREILPRLRAASGRPVAASVAGAGASAALVAAAAAADVHLLGPVGDLGPLYAEADMAVVPLRAGGGTRIKILEAFASQTPVVATPLAIEGIAAEGGDHALIADGPDAFARACLALAEDPQRARDVAARALRLVDEVYRADRVEAALLALYDASE